MKATFFFERDAYRGAESGTTVSKRSKLPSGDFRITEYSWGDTSLWFVDRDRFTADERQAVYLKFRAIAVVCGMPKKTLRGGL